MCIYGYVRVSTMKQDIDRQISNIKEKYPKATIIREDGVTGTTMDRPAWNKLYKKLKDGDTVIFDEVSRMARNADEGFEVYKELYNRGVNLIFLKEHQIDTDVFRSTAQVALTGNDIADVYIEATNKVLMMLAEKQIRIAFETAQAEVDFLHQRTSEGVKRAIERYQQEEVLGVPHKKKMVGRQTGAKIITKKERVAVDMILKKHKDFGGVDTDKELMDRIGCSRNSYYKYKAAAKVLRATEN